MAVAVLQSYNMTREGEYPHYMYSQDNPTHKCKLHKQISTNDTPNSQTSITEVMMTIPVHSR